MSKKLEAFLGDLPSKDSPNLVDEVIRRVKSLSPEEAKSVIEQAGLKHLTYPERIERILGIAADEGGDKEALHQ